MAPLVLMAGWIFPWILVAGPDFGSARSRLIVTDKHLQFAIASGIGYQQIRLVAVMADPVGDQASVLPSWSQLAATPTAMDQSYEFLCGWPFPFVWGAHFELQQSPIDEMGRHIRGLRDKQDIGIPLRFMAERRIWPLRVLWGPLLASGAVSIVLSMLAALSYRYVVIKRRQIQGKCPQCGYPSVAMSCPECGMKPLNNRTTRTDE